MALPNSSRVRLALDILAMAKTASDPVLLAELGLGVDLQKEAVLEGLQQAIGHGVRKVKDTAHAVGEHYGDVKRGLMDEIIRNRSRVEAGIAGAGTGAVLGGATRLVHGALNPKQEKWWETIGRKLFGGVDPNSFRGRATHALQSGAEGMGQGAMIGGPLGAFFYGPKRARAARSAHEARTGGEAPGLKDLAREAFNLYSAERGK